MLPWQSQEDGMRILSHSSLSQSPLSCAPLSRETASFLTDGLFSLSPFLPLPRPFIPPSTLGFASLCKAQKKGPANSS